MSCYTFFIDFRCPIIHNLLYSFSVTIQTSLFCMFNAPSFTHSSRLFLFHMVEQSCLLSSFRQLPVISICGATGTGKSELATNLASVFNGEVINFDALQLYNGLNIATNKIPPDKCLGVPHHLIGIYPPEYGDKYDVHSYRNICLPLIDNLRNTKKKLPILVGGTHYYLEAILWQDFLASKHTTSDTKDEFDRYRNLLITLVINIDAIIAYI
ncbi:tRNA dimethylallyltransferase 2 [Schistosoma japonicum]|nr:tRNA dimethylallyltransferase 2 [Schistosoma japonicum]